jgi:hypothetical protein
MHARNRTWLLGSDPVERCRQRTLPVEGGDGSTLSLDFITGILDPRLAFTRTTNATFINSQGYVQYADSNIFYNSSWTDANNTPSAWSVGSGTASRSEETRTFTTSASQVTINQTRNTASGIRYTASVEVTAVTGSQRIDDVIVGLGGSSYQYYFNGSAVAGTTTLIPGVVSVAFTVGGATTTVRVGSGVQGTNTTGSVTLRYPQFEPGTVPLRTYRPNDSTTASYQAPRFEYDPTTTPPTPRGLLIEGSATNLALRSNDFNSTINDGTNWTNSGYTIGDVSTTLPDGTTGNACRIFGSSSGSIRSTALTVSQNSSYTWSFWARNNGGSQARYRVWNATAGSSIVDYSQSANNYVSQIGGANNTSLTWVRVFVTFTTPTGCTSIYVYPCSSDSGTVDLLVWGAQVEAGSGASSYIPTGASQGSRAKDVCNITGSNFLSWFVDGPGTIVAQSDNVKSNTRNLLCQINKDGSNYIQMGVAAGAGSGEALFYNPDGFSQSGTTPSLNTAYKSAYVWDTTYFKMCLNGNLGSADVLGNIVSSGMVDLSIGGDLTNPTDVYIKNGHIRSLKYWPTRLPDAQLQALTT